MALMTAGLAAKTALFPLHIWLPPAHSGAPPAASALLSSLVVKASFFLTIRLWFDMAQIRAVAEQETAMRRNLARTFKLIFRNFGALFGMYFGISLLAWLGFTLAWWLWLRIPGERIGLSFILLELALVWWMGTRLWQRASETAWYERHAEVAFGALAYPIASEPTLSTVTALPHPTPID